MPHIILVCILSVWAFFALRDRPWWHYGSIYFLTILIAFPVEFLFSGVLQLYDLRTHLLPDPFHDVRLAAVFDKLGNLPLLAVLYARYCRKNPLVAAIIAATALGLLEVFFLAAGAIEYRHWYPAMTAVFFAIFFTAISSLATEAIRVPVWLHVGGMAFWVTFLIDVAFHGAFWLWHYDVVLLGTPRGDSRIFAMLFNLLAVGPMATALALTPELRGLRGFAVALGLLLLFEWFGLITGLILYDGWSLPLAVVRYGISLLLPMLYAGYLVRSMKRQASPVR